MPMTMSVVVSMMRCESPESRAVCKSSIAFLRPSSEKRLSSTGVIFRPVNFLAASASSIAFANRPRRNTSRTRARSATASAFFPAFHRLRDFSNSRLTSWTTTSALPFPEVSRSVCRFLVILLLNTTDDGADGSDMYRAIGDSNRCMLRSRLSRPAPIVSERCSLPSTGSRVAACRRIGPESSLLRNSMFLFSEISCVISSMASSCSCFLPFLYASVRSTNF